MPNKPMQLILGEILYVKYRKLLRIPIVRQQFCQFGKLALTECNLLTGLTDGMV